MKKVLASSKDLAEEDLTKEHENRGDTILLKEDDSSPAAKPKLNFVLLHVCSKWV